MSSSSPSSHSPKVSICLPTCDRPELIAACIDSCLAQSYGNLEIVIGDDSQDTRTQQLIAARYANEPRVRYESAAARPGAQCREPVRARERRQDPADSRRRSAHRRQRRKLVSLWARHPELEVAFADQYEADHGGAVDLDASTRLNTAFRRTKDAEAAARMRQFDVLPVLRLVPRMPFFRRDPRIA